MDPIIRNQIFLENEDMIHRTIRRNRALLCALGLDMDDVYQELALAALNAIDSFDAQRSESVKPHIWMKLQYAVLDIKRRTQPYGFTNLRGDCPRVVSIEYAERYQISPAAPTNAPAPELSPQLWAALSRLDANERQAVLNYVNQKETRQTDVLRAALAKMRSCCIVVAPGRGLDMKAW